MRAGVRHGGRLLLLLSLLLPLLMASAGASAASLSDASAWNETAHGRVRLIAGTEAVGTAATVPLGLQFELAPGWKIYWRTPGDAGFPPHIDWAGSVNLATATMVWPAPQRFTILDFETIGYEDAVVLPIDAQLTRPGEPLSLHASVDYLTCKDICVPYSAQLALQLPAGPAVVSAFSEEIAHFTRRVPPMQATMPTPGVAPGNPITIAAAALATTEPTLVVDARADAPLTNPDIFVEGPAELAFGAPRVERNADGRAATLRVPVLGEAAAIAALPGSRLTLTLVDTTGAVEHTVTVGTAAFEVGAKASTPAAAPTRSFAAVLVLALVGGLVLNLMPCVLPVLSIKLLSVVGHGGGNRRQVRLGFLATAAGILVSFLVLATVLIAVRAAGVAAGWGLQFQQPWFLVAMTLVVALFACNLWGLFELAIPAPVVAADARAAHVRGLGGHFLTGALATLLATPCSAPFVGTAIGFALTGGPLATLAIFAALAIGLAAPYLAVAAFPALATRLPQPGRWMLWLRRGLGLVLVGTGVWLLTILAAAHGTTYALTVGGLVAAMVLLLAVARSLLPARRQRFGLAAALVCAVAAFFVPLPTSSAPGAVAEHGWRPLDTAAIPDLVAAGHLVYVNVTADWCLTCKMNERLVLTRAPVATRLAEGDVITMRGDWTRPDEGIARYLASFGRYGIPFDAVYGPAVPNGVALPELLTADTVLTALAAAGSAAGRQAQVVAGGGGVERRP